MLFVEEVYGVAAYWVVFVSNNCLKFKRDHVLPYG